MTQFSEKSLSSNNTIRITLRLVLIIVLMTATLHAQTAGTAGVFSRMGFGARGMGMGNALTSTIRGDINTYYNPALSSFAGHRTGAATFGILSLDRYLNFLSYTQAIKPTAGISVGLINSGVRHIDGRDADGVHTEDYSTTENQFYLSFSNRVDPRLSLGVTVKLYYAKHFEDLSTTNVGFDFGILYTVNDQLTIGGSIQDINSKYKWDSKALYGIDGKNFDDKFPMLRRIGVTYELPFNGSVVSVEFENSSQQTNLLRFGAEYSPVDNFTIRTGADRIDFSDDATGVKPTFGFTLRNPFSSWTPAITYAYLIESFAPRGIHIITLSTSF